MCRIFLLWTPTNITDSEIKRMLSHSKQKDQKNDDYHTETAIDGYGLAGFSSQTHRWNIYKTEIPYTDDPNFPRVLDTFTQYSFIIGHMRKRPKWSTVGVENNHPFYYKNHVFLQYGDINGLEIPRKRTAFIHKLLPEFVQNIRGTTDSELLFYLFLTKCRDNIILPQECPQRFRQIYENDRTHYKPLCLLYMSIMKTLEYLHQHFPKITTNIIYSNKKYTMVLRHQHAIPPHKITTHNTLYWNAPLNNGKDHISITTRPINVSKTLIPDNTLVFIENSTGKSFVILLY